jgi:tetratricopeptide (TPR) repeat protein
MSRQRIAVVATALAALLVLLILAYVPDGQVAVRESFGGSTAVALGPGLHLRLPVYHRLYRYDTLPVTLDEPVEIVTKDNASFRLPITISARVSPGDLLTFHTGRAGRETRVYLEERLREAVRSAAKSYNADALLTADVGRLLGPVVSADLITRGIADDGLVARPPAPAVVLNAVVDYLRRKFPASARRVAEHALAADPKQALHHAAMGAVLEAEGRAADAERAYQDALFLDPTAFEPMSRLYILYQSSKDPQDLLRLERLLVASLEKKKDSPVHHDWLGQVYMRMGKADKAELAFTTAINLAPKDPEFRLSLGALKVVQGKLDEARAAYEEALKLRPNQFLALYNLGNISAMQGRMDAAIDLLHQAERTGPPNFALFNALAQAYQEKGDLARAAEYLKRSLQARPNQPDRQAALKRIEAALRKKS